MTNPLLAPVSPNTLPAFDAIQPEHAEPAIDGVLADNRAALDALLSGGKATSWEGLIEPLENLSDRMSRAWGPIQHLFGVTSTSAWRKAFNVVQPKITEYGLELSQNEALFQAYEQLAASPAAASFSPTRKKVLTDAIRDFKLSGIALPAEQKARYKVIALRLSELQTKFEENLLDAVQAWSKHVTDEALLVGMTEEGKAQAAEKAKAKELQGWLLTLDFPSYDAVISYADSRELRHELYEAYATRASELGPQGGQFDNTPLMQEIIALRDEEARLLGFNNFAELSLATKMAESPDAVEAFLLDLAVKAKPFALAELDELRAFAKARDGLTDLAPWDMAYYSEKLKEQKLGYSEEELRPYFPAQQVIAGMFEVVERMYGVRIEAAADIKTWHKDVTTWRLAEADGSEIGLFYLDPYARQDKRGGAWMDECLVRRQTATGLQRPVAYLTCNFTPPLGGAPALLTHDEVVTLFHEFGHGLHHLLTRVDEASVSGIRGVAWDAVELPSQFMENWCYDRATLNGFARHYKTGETIPDALLAKLQAGRGYQAGLMTLRQVEFSLFDLRLHRDTASGVGILDTLNAARAEVSVFPPPAWNRMPNSFGHIFAGGYAAGYYSYKWAEVLSADAFAAFEESDFSPDTGRRFRDTVLANGGSQDAMDLFVAFRGRKPEVEALLRHSGLVPDRRTAGAA
ncbi:M3 family metallopeptidase [uncultured Nevskia sp.]|uniref:M3 family metallopeptidase n=1 Tax=uncultured Nevskia sp. TaxID=228950 RepID=UPI0025F27C5C|nr:M3 family metallopeptidase [uncultured Nevskia sp.]